MRKRFDDEDERPGGFWRFVRGVVFALVVSVGAVAALSVYVLPPPEPPAPAPEPVEAEAGPEIVSGIEVATTPAYTGSSTGATGPVAPAAQPETG